MCKLPEVFIEDPRHVYPEMKRPSDEAYAQVIATTGKQACDTIIIDKKRKVLWLSYRLVHTQKDRWWNFGGSLKAREDYAFVAKRTFERDTGLNLPEERFQFVRPHRIWSATRAEIPHDAGEDCLVWQFALDLTEEERSRVQPNAERYRGLREFTRNDLAADPRLLPQLRFYDAVFGWRARFKRAVMRFLNFVLGE